MAVKDETVSRHNIMPQVTGYSNKRFVIDNQFMIID